MSILNKVVIGGLAFIAGVWVATKEEGDDKGQKKHHHGHRHSSKSYQQPQPGPWIPTENDKPPVKKQEPDLTFQIGKGDNGEPLGNLEVYRNLVDEDATKIDRGKVISFLKNFKDLTTNPLFREAVKMVLKKHGLDLNDLMAEPKKCKCEHGGPNSTSAVDCNAPEDNACCCQAGNPSKDPTEQSGVAEKPKSNADTVEHRAHSVLSISDSKQMSDI